MTVANVSSRWTNGSLEFYDVATGTTVFKVDTTGVGTMTRTGQRRMINIGAKVGATAGWVVGGGAVNTGLLATCPASQTAATLVVPIPGLKAGDTITSFTIHGRIGSVGGAVTLDAALRDMTPVAGGSTDNLIGSITQISKTANYLVNDSKTALTHSVATGDGYYVLLTATTAAVTSIEITSISITVTEA